MQVRGWFREHVGLGNTGSGLCKTHMTMLSQPRFREGNTKPHLFLGEQRVRGGSSHLSASVGGKLWPRAVVWPNHDLCVTSPEQWFPL